MKNKKHIDNKNKIIELFKRTKIKLNSKTDEQKEALKSIRDNQITILYGLAGTGKTHISAMWGLSQLILGKYKQLVLTRPCIEAYGEHVGFLPGTADDKIAPYMLPLFEIFHNVIDQNMINTLIQANIIRTIPLAYQRGLTYHETIIIADEMENAIPQQVRLLLTRIGRKSKMIITGDTDQSDLIGTNGLEDAILKLKEISDIGIVKLTESSIIRNPIIAKIEAVYSVKK
jgi:phosphate starvation-inducible PhoH-like protein